MKKRVLFIDRDGTLVEEPFDEQLDSFEKLKFVPGVFKSLSFLSERMDFEFVMATNQDGLGTPSYPEQDFKPTQDFILDTLAGEGIRFSDLLIDRSFPKDNLPTRKPGTGMFSKYTTGEYDLAGSYVIGDRATDVELAFNLGCKAILLQDSTDALKDGGMACTSGQLLDACAFYSRDWWKVAQFLFAGQRCASAHRATKETDILVELNLDGSGKCNISTGLSFFDHMLEQIGRHGGMDLTIMAKGDLNVDEHHTIEDTGIVLGQCIREALGDKRGIERYGFALPMDDCQAQVTLDFGGRSWLVWDAEFKREKVGDMPTEMFLHFFKSLSDAAQMNLNISARGDNEHHKIESIFKCLARALKAAVRRDVWHYELPSSKGLL